MDFRPTILLLSLSVLMSYSSGSPVTQSPTSPQPASKAVVSSYKYKVKDDGEEVEEEVTIDKEKQTETTHVAAHGDKDEADIISDFKLNLTLYILPGQGICLLGRLQKDAKSPDFLESELKNDEKNSESHEAKTTTTKWHGDSLVEDRSFLSDEMAAKCAKWPIYKMEEGIGAATSRKKRSSYTRCIRYCGRICSGYGYRTCVNVWISRCDRCYYGQSTF